jgi:hypothetical protein
MQNVFLDSLSVDMEILSKELGLSQTLTAEDIDFTNLLESYNQENDSTKAIVANFKSNSKTDPIQYAFVLYKMIDGNLYKPTIVKTITSKEITYFDLTDALNLSINDYDQTNFSYSTTTGTYIINSTSKVDCSQAVIDCVTDAYTHHGWLSIWAAVQSYVIPATSVAITAACIVNNCKGFIYH